MTSDFKIVQLHSFIYAYLLQTLQIAIQFVHSVCCNKKYQLH